MLTKEECLLALEDLIGFAYEEEYDCDMDDNTVINYIPLTKEDLKDYVSPLLQLINEHFELLEKYQELQDENARLSFDKIVNNIEDMNYKLWLDNPPLKFEELKEGMWVWDNLYKFYVSIVTVCENHQHFYVKNYDGVGRLFKFEENRFYRKQVE